jgi:hypothetical protein
LVNAVDRAIRVTATNLELVGSLRALCSAPAATKVWRSGRS